MGRMELELMKDLVTALFQRLMNAIGNVAGGPRPANVASQSVTSLDFVRLVRYLATIHGGDISK